MYKQALLLICLLSPDLTSTLLKTYKLNLDMVTVCPNNDELESPFRNVKYHFINRTHKALSMDITLKKPLNSEIGLITHLEQWGDARWIYTPLMLYHENACAVLQTYYKEVTLSVFRAFGVKEPEKCPVPAGNYSMRNFIFELPEIKAGWSGRYRVTVITQRGKNGPQVTCYMLTISTIEVL